MPSAKQCRCHLNSTDQRSRSLVSCVRYDDVGRSMVGKVSDGIEPLACLNLFCNDIY